MGQQIIMGVRYLENREACIDAVHHFGSKGCVALDHHPCNRLEKPAHCFNHGIPCSHASNVVRAQSFEYQRVLDGELAQRAETSRQLREVRR